VLVVGVRLDILKKKKTRNLKKKPQLGTTRGEGENENAHRVA
jgi:hypothetical protein